MSSLPSDLNLSSRGSRPNRKLASKILTVANTIVYECPRERSTEIVAISLCNVSGAKVSMRLFHVIPADTAGTSNAIFYDYAIDTHSTTFVDSTLYMSPGDKLVAYASAASAITIIVYGIEA